MEIVPVVLEGKLARLEPLGWEHETPLAEVAFDPLIWRHMLSEVGNRDELRLYMANVLAEAEAGAALPWAIRYLPDNRVVGSTRFGAIERKHRTLELGWTWVAPAWQRTGVNVECKYLLLRHAFETLGCVRVTLKTDARNEQSARAIAALGATREGVLRNHMVRRDGSLRDTIMFSVIDREWPAVRTHLEQRLACHRALARGEARLPL